MKRPSVKQAGVGAGVLVVVVVLLWLLAGDASSSTTSSGGKPSYNRKYEGDGIPFKDAAASGQPIVGVYGIDWF